MYSSGVIVGIINLQYKKLVITILSILCVDIRQCIQDELWPIHVQQVDACTQGNTKLQSETESDAVDFFLINPRAIYIDHINSSWYY